MIPKDWEIKELRELCEIKGRIGFRGYTTNDIVKQGEGAITLSPSNFENGFITFSNCTYISWFKYEESPEIKIDIGDILLVKTGSTFGKSARVVSLPEKATVNPQIVVFKKIKTDKVFLSYLVADEIFQKQIRTVVVGGAIPTLSQENILSFLLPIPPIAEQIKIADILSTCDEAIDKLSKLIVSKEKQKKGLMQNLLTGKVRFKEFEKDKWCEFPLSEAAWYQEGPGLRTWQFAKSGIKVINITNIVDGVLDLSKTDRHISIEEFNKTYKHFEIQAGDIVIASSGNSYCKHGVVRDCDLPLVMNTSVIRFKPLENCDYEFLNQFLKSPFLKTQIDILITGGAQPNFGPAHLAEITIPLPTLREQQKIAQTLKSADDELFHLKEQLDKFKQQKKGLMQQLLTGKIRVK